jgi:hypothetical protein
MVQREFCPLSLPLARRMIVSFGDQVVPFIIGLSG